MPYRHCLGNALINAEMLRGFMHPQNNVVMANFWQFANEYWSAVKGRAFYRDLRVQKFTPKRFPAVPYLSVNASRKGNTVFLMVVNKNVDAPIAAAVRLTDFTPRRAKTWTLTGPSVDATNEKDANTVTVKERDLGAVKNGFLVELPPHSLTAGDAP